MNFLHIFITENEREKEKPLFNDKQYIIVVHIVPVDENFILDSAKIQSIRIYTAIKKTISGYAPIPVGPPQASPSSSSSSANQLQPNMDQRSPAQNQRTPSPARMAAGATQPQKSPSQPNAATQQQHPQKLTPDRQTSRHCKIKDHLFSCITRINGS